MAQAAPGSLDTPAELSTIISTITNGLSEQLHDFAEECISHGRRTRIFDADGFTELSMDGLLKKYYSKQ